MRYEEPQSWDRSDLTASVAKGDIDAIREALVSMTFEETDWEYAQDRCLELLRHESDAVKQVALTCLGNVARNHAMIDKAKVLPALEPLRSHPTLFGYVIQAEEDMAMALGEIDDEDPEDQQV